MSAPKNKSLGPTSMLTTQAPSSTRSADVTGTSLRLLFNKKSPTTISIAYENCHNPSRLITTKWVSVRDIVSFNLIYEGTTCFLILKTLEVLKVAPSKVLTDHTLAGYHKVESSPFGYVGIFADNTSSFCRKCSIGFVVPSAIVTGVPSRKQYMKNEGTKWGGKLGGTNDGGNEGAKKYGGKDGGNDGGKLGGKDGGNDGGNDGGKEGGAT